MHPHLIGQIAQQRASELRQSATDGRATTAHDPSRPSISNRAGWTLVHIGLRLATR